MNKNLASFVKSVESNTLTYTALRIFRRVRAIYKLVCSSNSILHTTAWLQNAGTFKTQDLKGNPIPWLGYAVIRFLEQRLTYDISVFEYGSGQSTLWWSRRVSKICSVEHDKDWFSKYVQLIPENVKYLFRPLDDTDKYENSIMETGDKFEIIVVDGRRRVKCISKALEALTDDGVIVLDNSDRKKYIEGITMLKENHFRQMEFFGLAPIGVQGVGTSIFYRRNNVLKI